MSNPGEEQRVVADEIVVLSKYEGDPVPENEFERIHIQNGSVVSRQKIENGKVVFTEGFPPKPTPPGPGPVDPTPPTPPTPRAAGDEPVPGEDKDA